MADVVVTIKRYNSGWDSLFPRTVSDQIADATIVGKNFIKKTTPLANAFLQVDTDGDINERNAVQLRSDISASQIGHTHTTDQISNNGDTLTTILGEKADLSGGTIISSQIPDFLLGGMRYHNTISGGTLALDTLTSGLPGNAAEQVGLYVIMGQDTVVTFTTSSIGGVGDEGETASGLTLEAGDWLVYEGANVWNVVNNTYRVASTDQNGVVKISDGSITSRTSLSSTSSGLKVIDENALRSVLKDIHYGGSPSGLTGDLWFDGTFV
jgi:hypothetical protein